MSSVMVQLYAVLPERLASIVEDPAKHLKQILLFFLKQIPSNIRNHP